MEGTLPALRGYFTARPAEALIRYALHEGRLPEYLASRARALIEGGITSSLSSLPPADEGSKAAWNMLADMIWTWRHSPVATDPGTHTVHGSACLLYTSCLFIDARSYGVMIDRTHRELTEMEVNKIAKAYDDWRNGENGTYQDIPGFCRVVSREEIARHKYALVPGRYVGFDRSQVCLLYTSRCV